MKCEKCGKEINFDASWCPYCGTEIIDEKTETDIPVFDETLDDVSRLNQINRENVQNCSTCTRCGQPVHFGYKLCPKCTSYENEMNNRRERQVHQRQNSGVRATSLILIFVLVALVVFMVVASACIIVLKLNSSNGVAVMNDGDNPIGSEVVSDSAKISKKYYVVTPNVPGHIMTWKEAKLDAASRGGYIACPNSKEEFDEICQMAQGAGLYIVWLGAERTIGQSWDDVDWYNGKPMLYTKWFTGKVEEPSYTDKGRDELYLTACVRDKVWGYNDTPNDISYAFSANEYASRVGYILEKEE